MFRLRDELRAGVQWRCENLAGPEFLAGELPFHVVFCRNVLIYFHAEARRMAVRHLHRLLSREGILCATPAEARIFNAAGFASLGSECPLAFRHRDAIAAESPAPAIAEKPTTLVGQVRNLSYVEPNAGAPDVKSFNGPGDPSYKPSSSVGQVCKLSCVEPNAGAPDVKSFNGPGDPFHELGPALLRAARAAADNGRLEEADALCSRMLSQNPASAEAHCLGGVIHQAQGRLDEARRSFEKALYLDPRHYEALVHMMLLAEQTGDCVGAANYRRRADRVAPGETE
jgi:chemotaxis protein methyltransferase WspC